MKYRISVRLMIERWIVFEATSANDAIRKMFDGELPIDRGEITIEHSPMASQINVRTAEER
jgi:hypothetical protein